MAIWPVPEGHVGALSDSQTTSRSKVTLANLIAEGLISVGDELTARKTEVRGQIAVVVDGGGLPVGDRVFFSPSAAAKALTGCQVEAGWWFWLASLDPIRSLADVRREYRAILGVDADDDEE